LHDLGFETQTPLFLSEHPTFWIDFLNNPKSYVRSGIKLWSPLFWTCESPPHPPFILLSVFIIKNKFGLFVCANQTFLWFSNFYLRCSIVSTLSTIMYALSFNLGPSKVDVWGNRSIIQIDRITSSQSYKVVPRWSDNLSNNRTREGLTTHSNYQVTTFWKQCVRKDLNNDWLIKFLCLTVNVYEQWELFSNNYNEEREKTLPIFPPSINLLFIPCSQLLLLFSVAAW
jgi:hypothetical protein